MKTLIKSSFVLALIVGFLAFGLNNAYARNTNTNARAKKTENVLLKHSKTQVIETLPMVNYNNVNRMRAPCSKLVKCTVTVTASVGPVSVSVSKTVDCDNIRSAAKDLYNKAKGAAAAIFVEQMIHPFAGFWQM